MKHLKIRMVLMGVMLTLVLGLMVHAQDQAPATLDTDTPVAVAPQEQPAIDAGEQGRAASLYAKLRAGGAIVVVQILMSVVGFGIVIERLINLQSRAILPPRLAADCDAMWRKGEYEPIRQRCKQQRSILAVAIAAMLDHRGDPRSEALSSAAAAGRPLLRKQLQKAYPIAIIAMLLPLLGLLGTVWGLIGPQRPNQPLQRPVTRDKRPWPYSTVTLLARFLGLSTLQPRATAAW
jgi:hypothetical protein